MCAGGLLELSLNEIAPSIYNKAVSRRSGKSESQSPELDIEPEREESRIGKQAGAC